MSVYYYTNNNIKVGVLMLLMLFVLLCVVFDSSKSYTNYKVLSYEPKMNTEIAGRLITNDYNNSIYGVIKLVKLSKDKSYDINLKSISQEYVHDDNMIESQIFKRKNTKKYEHITDITQPTEDFCKKITVPNEEEIEMRNNFWQTYKISGNTKIEQRIFAIQSYYDDRPALNGSVFIRTFVVTTGDGLRMLERMNCYLWFEGIQHPLIASSNVMNVNQKRELIVNNTIYKNYVFSCHVPQDIALNNSLNITHASLTFKINRNYKCGKAMLYLPVIYPEKPAKWSHTFGMCEANGVSFGRFEDKFAPWLIEWFEANIMFGITEFNIYNATLTVAKNVKKVLDYYQDKGYLKLHQHPTVLENYDPFHRDSADIGMRTSYNDCLYRNMYRYKYLAGIDLDEIIVPRKHKNYTELLNVFERIENYTYSYKVKANAFFQSFFGNDDTRVDSKYPLKTSQYINFVHDHRTKLFLNPTTCIAAFSHGCFSEIKTAQPTNRFMSTSLASVHHYRHICLKANRKKFSKQSCLALTKETHVNERMLHFQDQLYKGVSQVAKKLKIKLSV